MRRELNRRECGLIGRHVVVFLNGGEALSYLRGKVDMAVVGSETIGVARIRRTSDGERSIQALAEAAQTLVALFFGMAELLGSQPE